MLRQLTQAQLLRQRQVPLRLRAQLVHKMHKTPTLTSVLLLLPRSHKQLMHEQTWTLQRRATLWVKWTHQSVVWSDSCSSWLCRQVKAHLVCPLLLLYCRCTSFPLTALGRQYLTCTYLAHYELKCVDSIAVHLHIGFLLTLSKPWASTDPACSQVLLTSACQVCITLCACDCATF